MRKDPLSIRRYKRDHALLHRLITLFLFKVYRHLIERPILRLFRLCNRRSLNQQAQFLTASARGKHIYVTGQTNSGKSKLLEYIIYSYEQARSSASSASIIIDPHGDFGQAVARHQSNLCHDRLVYIKPALNAALTPCLNPFDTPSKQWPDINRATDALIGTLQELMAADDSASRLSARMISLIKPCIAALMIKDDTTFNDFVAFMDRTSSRYGPYLEFAKKTLKNPSQRQALEDFEDPDFTTSKRAIKTKLRILLNDDHFYNFFVGKSTFNLEREINRQAIIIIDLGELAETAKSSIARFLISTITSKSLIKASCHRRPIHLFIDECHICGCASIRRILKEARKFGLHVILAQQTPGEDLDTTTFKSILTNTKIKVTGANEKKIVQRLADNAQVPTEEFLKLKPGEFYVTINGYTKRQRMPMVSSKMYMDQSQWKQTLGVQLARYYQPNFTALSQPPHKHIRRPYISNRTL